MKVSLNETGKKYYREWIFRKTTLAFLPGQKSVVLGPNGSGKSTLLQVISGSVMLTEGNINYEEEGKQISPESIFKFTSLAAPYLELIEEFSLREIVQFHFKFKSILSSITEQEILEMTGLSAKADQTFKFFSSGMKQRIKLSLALFSDTPLLLLDEPCSNLDAQGIEWYKQNMNKYALNRTVIVASNKNKDEYFFCNNEINIADYKL